MRGRTLCAALIDGDGADEAIGCADLLSLALSAAIAFAIVVAIVIMFDLQLPSRAFPLLPKERQTKSLGAQEDSP